MAMALYPEIMRKAQDEIDALLGENSDNPPSFEHIDHLPYVVALCKEVFRFVHMRILSVAVLIGDLIVQMDPCRTRWLSPSQRQR